MSIDCNQLGSQTGLLTAALLRLMASHVGRQFKRVYIDEAHDALVPPPDRIPNWIGAAETFASYDVSLVFVTATLPLLAVTKLARMFKLRTGTYKVLRFSTSRPEIGLHVVTAPNENGIRALHHLVRNLTLRLKSHERILVFFNMRDEVEAFAREHRCPEYRSDLPSTGNTKDRNLFEWDSGVSKVMACTAAFGYGVDRPHVRFVVLAWLTLGMYAFTQMVGRAGRDGEPSHAFYVKLSNDGDYKGFFGSSEHMGSKLENLVMVPQCRRMALTKTMDGEKFMTRCGEERGSQLCDYCDPRSRMQRVALKAIENCSGPLAILPGTGSGELASAAEESTVRLDSAVVTNQGFVSVSDGI